MLNLLELQALQILKLYQITSQVTMLLVKEEHVISKEIIQDLQIIISNIIMQFHEMILRM